MKRQDLCSSLLYIGEGSGLLSGGYVPLLNVTKKKKMKEPLFQALFFYNFPFIIIIIICCQAICFDMFKNDFYMYTCTSCFAQRISEGARARNCFPGVSPIFFILLTDVLSCVYMFEQLGKDEEPKQFLKEGEIKTEERHFSL